jgi:hypothetical protein
MMARVLPTGPRMKSISYPTSEGCASLTQRLRASEWKISVSVQFPSPPIIDHQGRPSQLGSRNVGRFTLAQRFALLL